MSALRVTAPDRFTATTLADQLADAGFTTATAEGPAGLQLDDRSTLLVLPTRRAALMAAARMLEREAKGYTLPGGVAFNPAARSLVKDGHAHLLTEKEAALLAALATGKTLTREALLQQVWGYGEDVNTHTLETHIHRLRAKLADITGNENLIVNDGGGYRLGA